MKAAIGFALAMLCALAYVYGYDFAMTVEGFPIQGYIGALIPVILVLLGAWAGVMLGKLCEESPQRM